MSIISDIHTATIYDPKKSKPFAGQRLVVTIAKKDKDGNYGPHLQQTQCTSIPTLAVSDIDFSSKVVQELCVSYFHTIQNAIISERIKSGKKDVTTSEIGQNAITSYLTAESSGDKWDAPRVAEWFRDNLAEHIGVALIEKGFDDTKLEAGLKAYEKLISETMSSKVVIPRKKAEAIDKALKLVPIECQDSTFCKFQTRIEKVLNDQSLDDLLGL